MQRPQLEHVIRAAAGITGTAEIIVIGLCLEVHDLAVSKLVAGREKDLEFVAGLLRHRLANGATIRERLDATPIDDARHQIVVGRLQRLS